jgi:hypothetical protein
LRRLESATTRTPDLIRPVFILSHRFESCDFHTRRPSGYWILIVACQVCAT